MVSRGDDISKSVQFNLIFDLLRLNEKLTGLRSTHDRDVRSRFVWTCGAWSKDDPKNEIEQLYIIELIVF